MDVSGPRILVVGHREFLDAERIRKLLLFALDTYGWDGATLVHTGAEGAARIAVHLWTGLERVDPQPEMCAPPFESLPEGERFNALPALYRDLLDNGRLTAAIVFTDEANSRSWTRTFVRMARASGLPVWRWSNRRGRAERAGESRKWLARGGGSRQ